MGKKIKIQVEDKTSTANIFKMDVSDKPKDNNNPTNGKATKKKKIVICSIKKDPLDQLIDRIKNEGDFIKKISEVLKLSQQCQACEHLKIAGNKDYFCTNFEALWYHRDTQFAHFTKCSYKKAKKKNILTNAS